MSKKSVNESPEPKTAEQHDDDEDEESSEHVRVLGERAILMLSGPIREGHLGICAELLSYHFRPDFNDHITLLINSPGGSCEIGWAIVDVMNFIRLPVHTVVIGLAASMAADIFVNGDQRTMGEHSTLMIHQHSSLSAGSHSKLLASIKGDIIEHNRRLRHYVSNSKYKNIKQVEEKLLNIQGEDLYLTPEECLEHGLTDSIAISNKKAKRRKAPAIGAELMGQTIKHSSPSKTRRRTNKRSNRTT